MKTVNSISGGKTSAYIAKHYPSDINIFSLVRIDDKECLWMGGKDEKTRQLISDRIGKEFIGTAEMATILKFSIQGNLFNDDDFSDCDSGNCEL